MFRHKFKNKITEYKGVKYRSKLEADYAKHLFKLKDEGALLWFNRQVIFDFPDGNSYLCHHYILQNPLLVSLLSVATLLPHFSLSAETYPLISFFMSRRQTTAIRLLSLLLCIPCSGRIGRSLLSFESLAEYRPVFILLVLSF